MNELKSYTEYAVSTPTADFVIGFDFNYGEDAVNVTVDDVPASVAGYTVVYLNETTIRLSPSVPSGVVRLQRETDIDQTDHAYRAGAKFIAQTMDENFEQLRHSQQEVRDGFNKLADDTYEIIDTLQEVGQSAQDAANAAEVAAGLANDAAAQVNDKVSYEDFNSKPHNAMLGRDVAAAHPTDAILDGSGETQQQVNYNGGSKWHSRVGGYLENERVILTNGDIVKSAIDGNTNDPNVDMTGWVLEKDASQLKFKLKPNLIGSSLLEKMSERVSVKDFGAIGDGTKHTVQEWIDAGEFSNLTAVQMVFPFVTSVNDSIDWVALQGAIKSLPLNTASTGILTPKGFANGGCIYIPRGRYYIDKKVSMQRGLRLTGESRESSQLISFIAADSFLQYKDSGRYIQDEIIIENLSIWQDASVIATAGAAIDVIEGSASVQSVYLKVDNVIIEGTYNGVRLVAGVGCAVRNSNISKCVNNGVYLTGLSSTTSTVFENTYCHINGNYGFEIEKGAYIAFVGCASDSNAVGGYHINQTKGYSFTACGAEANTGAGVTLSAAGGGSIELFAIANTGGVIDSGSLLSGPVNALGGDWEGVGFAVRGGGDTPVHLGRGLILRGDYSASRVVYQKNVLDESSGVVGKFVGGNTNKWAIGAIQQAESDSCFSVSGIADADTVYAQKILHSFTGAGANRNAALYAQAITSANAVTYPLIVGAFIPNAVQGAGSTITRSAGAYIVEQTRGSLANANIMVDGGQGTVPAGNWSIYSGSARPSYYGGQLTWKPSAIATPAANGDLTFEATSNTSITVKLKGSDGVIRSAVLTLS